MDWKSPFMCRFNEFIRPIDHNGQCAMAAVFDNMMWMVSCRHAKKSERKEHWIAAIFHHGRNHESSFNHEAGKRQIVIGKSALAWQSHERTSCERFGLLCAGFDRFHTNVILRWQYVLRMVPRMKIIIQRQPNWWRTYQQWFWVCLW